MDANYHGPHARGQNLREFAGEEPMPDSEFSLASAVDGFSLHGYAWRARGNPKALVAISHGAAEHALRYDAFARALGDAGFETFALDQRGHGRSPGSDGLGDFGAGGWAGLVADIGQLIALARTTRPGVPLALFGHSMGSFAAQQFCFDQSRACDALVLSGSTAFDLSASGGALPAFTPNQAFEPARTAYDWLSRDSAEVDKYVADPLCGFETQRGRQPGAGIDFAKLGDAAGIARIRAELPVLLVAGDEDPLNAKLAGLRLLESRWRDAGVVQIETCYYSGGRHEMLNETNRDEVTKDIVTWLGRTLER
jgi:alpha-beta hydrolase superfamily lysophospholipase